MTDLVLSSTILYIFVVGMRSFKQIHKKPRKILARKILIILAISVPLFIHDEFLSVLPLLHPLCYIAMCLIMSHHFFSYSFQHVESPPASKPETPVENAAAVVESFMQEET